MRQHLMTHREQAEADCRARNQVFAQYALAVLLGGVLMFVALVVHP